VATQSPLRPGDPKYGPRFGLYLKRMLAKRIVDWYRKEKGQTRWAFKNRVYERPRPEFVSLDGPEHDRLDAAQGAWTVTHVALPISCGLSTAEVAGRVGETTTWVTKRLKALRGELERL
jgi:hypothetical protein